MRILREAECRAITGLSRSTRYRLERSGLFPRRCQLSKNSIGWFEKDVRDWLYSRLPSDDRPCRLDRLE